MAAAGIVTLPPSHRRGHPGAVEGRLPDAVPVDPAARPAGPRRWRQEPGDSGAASPARRAALLTLACSTSAPPSTLLRRRWSRVRSGQTTGMRPRRLRPAPATRSAFAGFRFPPEVIVLATRWYLRFGLSYRDVEELLAERGIEVDHVTVYRWVPRFTPLLAEAARPCRHAVGDRWV